MLALTVTLYFLSALAGLAIGSFLNVVIYRLPKGTFFSKARSFCPKCGAPIKAYDNIPVISYLILKGKCRNCHASISPRYPLIEALNCILWVVNFAVYGISWMTLVYDVLVSVLIVVAMIDFDTFEIPDSSNITILLLGLVTFFPISGVSWQSKLIGCVCISLPMLILALFGGMGLGDVKLYFVLGLLFGWQKILVIFLISVVVGGIFSIVYMIVRKRKEQNEVDSEEEKKLSDTAVGNAETSSEDKTSDCAENNAEGEKETSVIIADDKSIASEDGAQKPETFACDEAQNDKKEDEAEDEVPAGKAIPFGPFIALATLITVYLGDLIIKGYTNLIF